MNVFLKKYLFADIKPIKNEMACRRVSVPNDDDTVGKAFLNIVRVLPP